jgi:phosphate transport system permease protein
VKREPRLRGEAWTEAALFGAALVSALAVIAVFAFLLYFALPLALAGQIGTSLTWTWRPFQGHFGILPMVVGSFCLAVSAMLIAFPVGVGICCFAHGLGHAPLARLVMALVRFMTSVPTVVYGFVAVFLLTPVIRAAFSHSSGFSWLTAALVLALIVLPTVVLLIDGQFRVIEERVRLTTAALGLSRSQSLVHVVLPLSRRGLLAAATLGFGRAVGDTLVPLMLAGNAPQIPASPLDSIRSLTAHIALVLSTESGSKAYASLFAAGLILLATALAVNLALRAIQARST